MKHVAALSARFVNSISPLGVAAKKEAFSPPGSYPPVLDFAMTGTSFTL